MNKFEVINKTEEKIDIKSLQAFVEYALNYENINNAIFDIILVDNKTIRNINNEYRHIDKETDVISFAFEDNEEIVFDFGRVLGEIYISIPKMKSQAKEYGHSEQRELFFLAVHGLLHLLGYDHMTKEDEKIMFRKQELILDGYGIKK